MTPQSMPAGALVPVPIAVPLGMSVTAKLCTAKVTVTVVAAVTVTTQGSVPLHPPPLQPVKTEPASGVAVNETDVMERSAGVQVTQQSMPAGALGTVRVPVPVGMSVRAK